MLMVAFVSYKGSQGGRALKQIDKATDADAGKLARRRTVEVRHLRRSRAMKASTTFGDGLTAPESFAWGASGFVETFGCG